MANVYFSGACQDENGNAVGGKAGDQTGNEIRTRAAYTHSLGWRIFRYPDSTIAYWIGTNALNIAANNHFGYDQGQRTTGYNASKAAGWEPKNVTTDCELDCSEMVRTCVACAMEKDIADFNTSSEPSVLLKLGFKEITGTALSDLKLGDIVCTKTKGHTEIVSKVIATVSVSTSTCYPKYTGSSTSITTALKAVGETDTSLTHRKKIALANGVVTKVENYTGTSAQNTAMMKLLKAGTLKKA